MNKKAIDKITAIAEKHILGVENRGCGLETAHSGDKDFFEVAIWELREALMEAYKAGQEE